MANIKLTGNTWDTSGIYDPAQEKTQDTINAEAKYSVLSAKSLLDATKFYDAQTTLHGRVITRKKNTCTFSYSSANSQGRWYTALRNNTAAFDYNTSLSNLAKAASLITFYQLPTSERIILTAKMHVSNSDETARKLPILGIIYVTDPTNMSKNVGLQFWDSTNEETYTTKDIVFTYDITPYGRYFLPVIYSYNSRQEVTVEFSLTSEKDPAILDRSISESNDSILWEFGYRAVATGDKTYSTSDVRTKNTFYLPPGTLISVDDGYKFGVIAYNGETGVYTYGVQYQTAPYLVGDTMYTPGNIGYFRKYAFNLARVDGTAFTSVDQAAPHIHFTLPINAMLDEVTYEVKQLKGVSKFNKENINFTGAPVSEYYKGQGESYNAGFGSSTVTSEVITAFDSLLETYGANYMTKTELGLASDNTTQVVEYDLVPKKVESSIRKTHAKVLVVSAQHGFEKNSVYGLYYFVRDLLINWDKSPVLDFIRNHVVLKIIPIVNPYGFDNNVYLNANGVNLNRNYDMPGWPADPNAQPGETYYSGAAPFDQPETQYVRDFVYANKDAFLYVDFHTNGQSSVAEWNRINWNSLVSSADPYYHHMFEASRYHLENITAHFAKDYSLNLGTDVCGYITGSRDHDSTSCCSDSWVTAQDIKGMTLEGFCGFKNMTAFSADSQKANSELIGNYIMAVINTYSNLA